MAGTASLQENKCHGEKWFPFDIYPCTIPKDFPQVALHWQNSMELVFVKKGSGLVQVGLEPVKAQAGDIFVFAPGMLHGLGQLPGEVMEYENIIFHPNMLISKQSDSCSTNFLSPLLAGRITVPTIFTPVYPYYKDIATPIDACDEICKTKPQGYELFIKSQLYQLLFILDNRCRNLSSANGNKKTLDKMKLILKYVENHYMNHITIADVATIVDFSESHFMRYFKDTMGTSFIDYLKDYRLTMASRLLTSSDSTILDIAAEVGFENLSYFNRAFKAKYHMTPNQFRHTPELQPHH